MFSSSPKNFLAGSCAGRILERTTRGKVTSTEPLPVSQSGSVKGAQMRDLQDSDEQETELMAATDFRY